MNCANERRLLVKSRRLPAEITFLRIDGLIARKQTDHRGCCDSTRGREPRNRTSLSSLSSSPESCYPSVEIVTEHRKLGFSRERVKPSRRYSQITRSEGLWRFCKHPANRSLILLRGLAFLSNLPFQRLGILPFHLCSTNIRSIVFYFQYLF